MTKTETQVSQIFNNIIKETKNGSVIKTVNKNGVAVPKVTILEDIMLRNKDNLDTIALEIVGSETKLTYREFFRETEKYMSAFKNMGLKENDIVSLCLPVGIEFICAYFAATTLGIGVNTLNIMSLIQEGVDHFLDKKCSHTLMIDKNFYQLLLAKGQVDDEHLKNIIVAGDATYNHYQDSSKIEIPNYNLQGVDIIAFDEFLKTANPKDVLKAVEYNEERISTLSYTSGTTGRPKCMAHSDLAPLFLNATHDSILRNESKKDRTLLTIPFSHPTGLFYAMVFQMAEGKTLVLEPTYDKTLFSKDIVENQINHAVQAKTFYAQIVQDYYDGKISAGEFSLFKNAYSGGEGISRVPCQNINKVLDILGCHEPLVLGYGRSEEGSSTMAPYNLDGRANTVGVPLPGITAKISEAETLKDLPQIAGIKGEILVNTPVHPLYHAYLGDYNQPLMSDNSVIDDEGNRFARPNDIATLVELPNGKLSYLVEGRAFDYVLKNQKKQYLFDIKEKLSNLKNVQECEVLSIKNEKQSFVTAHIVLSNAGKTSQREIITQIAENNQEIDAIKVYDKFGVNATSGKCDRETMQSTYTGYYSLVEGDLVAAEFVQENGELKKKIRTR